MGLKAVYILFILFFLLTVFLSIRKSEKQVINTYSFFAFEFFIKILLSSLIVYLLTGRIVLYEESLQVLYISFVFLIAIWLGFATKKMPYFFIRHSNIFFKSTKRLNRFHVNLRRYGFLFLILGIILYILLMINGGGGYLWITNTRTAYQFYRKGAGGFYVFSQIFLYLSYISFLLKLKKKSILKITILTLFFLLMFYFYGSKRSLLTLVLIGIVFYSYYVKRIKIIKISAIFIIIAVLFLVSQSLYSSYGYDESINYFTYFDNMTLFLEGNPNFQFMYGKSSFSNLWGLVPRSIYPDKPFVYGSAYITEFVYPGMAEKTHTIGVLPWASYYLDFGYLGVFFGGLLTGVSLQYVQLLFKNNKSFFVFIIFINYGVSNILKHLPFFMLFFLIILSINFLRLSIKK